MKIYIHSQTPKPKMSKTIKIMFIITSSLFLSIFLLAAFVCFFIANSIIGGIILILIPIFLFALVYFSITDLEKAYIEICEDHIVAVEFFAGISKIKRFQKDDIQSYKFSKSLDRIPGTKLKFVRYIVFYDKNGKYLFKIYHDKSNEALLQNILWLHSAITKF